MGCAGIKYVDVFSQLKNNGIEEVSSEIAYSTIQGEIIDKRSNVYISPSIFQGKDIFDILVYDKKYIVGMFQKQDGSFSYIYLENNGSHRDESDGGLPSSSFFDSKSINISTQDNSYNFGFFPNGPAWQLNIDSIIYRIQRIQFRNIDSSIYFLDNSSIRTNSTDSLKYIHEPVKDFSIYGENLAILYKDRISIHDLSSGEIIREILPDFININNTNNPVLDPKYFFSEARYVHFVNSDKIIIIFLVGTWTLASASSISLDLVTNYFTVDTDYPDVPWRIYNE